MASQRKTASGGMDCTRCVYGNVQRNIYSDATASDSKLVAQHHGTSRKHGRCCDNKHASYGGIGGDEPALINIGVFKRKVLMVT